MNQPCLLSQPARKKVYGLCIGMLVALMLCGCARQVQVAPAAEEPTWEYSQVTIEDRGSIFTTTIRIFPSNQVWPIGNAADLLNLVSKTGWQEVWISGNGKEVLVKRINKGSGAGAILSSTEQKK